MGYGGYVLNHKDIESGRLQRPERGFATGTRPFDVHLNVFHALFHRFFSGILCGYLGRERGALSRSLKPLNTGTRPRNYIADRVGNGNNGIVECRLDMNNAV